MNKKKMFFYKGESYTVVGKSKFKSVSGDGKWIQGIQYKRTSQIEDEDADIFTRDIEDFCKKFIPRFARRGMRILEISMGKIVAIYEHESTSRTKAKFISKEHGISLTIKKEIQSSGYVTKLYGGRIVEGSEYVVMTPAMEESLELRKMNISIASKLHIALMSVDTLPFDVPREKIQYLESKLDVVLSLFSEIKNGYGESNRACKTNE